MVGCIPAVGDYTSSPATALQKLNLVLAGPVAKFCNRNTASAAKACVELVSAISAGVPPTIPAGSGAGLLHIFVSKLPQLLAIEDGNRQIQGQAAVDALYKHFSLKGTTGRRLKDLEPLVVYHWLLPPGGKANVQAWAKEIIKQLGGASTSVPHASQPGGAASSGASKSSSLAKGVKNDKRKASALALFS